MENLTTFLESSTIHGLAYIATGKKYMRLFWILVVIAGFTGAGVLIYTSFQSWEESPVKTTIETLPITEITLPKVTVCPPKNTYTDLNYDLMIAENMTLDNTTRNELTDLALRLLWDQLHNETMANLSKVEDNKRYYNWYKGITEIGLPTYNSSNGLTLIINTYDTSGFISTKYFGNKFNGQNVERHAHFEVQIHSSPKYQYNDSITLHMKVEQLSVNDLMDGYERYEVNSKNFMLIDNWMDNFRPPIDKSG